MTSFTFVDCRVGQLPSPRRRRCWRRIPKGRDWQAFADAIVKIIAAIAATLGPFMGGGEGGPVEVKLPASQRLGK